MKRLSTIVAAAIGTVIACSSPQDNLKEDVDRVPHRGSYLHATGADVNGDGKYDRLVMDWNGDVHLYLNNGAGYDNKGVILKDAYQTSKNGFWLEDMDQDGKPEMLGMREGGLISVYKLR